MDLSIGEVAQRTGLETSAIRYYERRGLLPPAERVNGRRRYDADILTLLGVIEVGKEAGFSLREIERLLEGLEGGDPPSKHWRELAAAKLAELEELSQRIEDMRALLRRGIECGCLRLEDCELVAAQCEGTGA